MKYKKYHLIYFFSLLFFILSLVSTTTAQTSYLDSLDGKFALQFQINQNFSLSDFQGTTFSGKYHFGKRDAARLGVSLDFEDGTGDWNITYFDIDSTAKADIDENSFSINLKMQYICYLINTNEISFYGGIGPSVEYSKRESVRNYNPPIDDKLEQSKENLKIGLDLIAGVEWMFSSNMSLSAEYGILFYYKSSEEKFRNESREANYTLDSIGLSANHVNFGISIYF